ncbi:MAG TPA: GNAT family N-acetyltransferase [Aliidongia sp.]|nr:GNAT family N-acetyltransferase [Aliidongia sp.]
MADIVLETARLRLEPWSPVHLDGLSVLNGDPLVMRYIGGVPQTRDETTAAIERQRGRWDTHGFGWWSFIDRTNGKLIGAGCIQHLAGGIGNPLEIGWRLRPDCWGQGFASEAARAMAAFAFDRLSTPTLLAVADPENTASRRVMERLGMRYRGIEYWYEQDVATYEITVEEWRAGLGRF